MKFTCMAIGLALTLTAPNAWAGDKQQTTQELIRVAQEIRTQRASGLDVSQLQARYDELSASLGGDDPARLLGGAPTASVVGGQLNAVTSVPPGSSSTTTSFASANVVPTVDNAVVTDTILAGGLDAYLWDVDVTINVTHTWASDLDLYLVSPSGTRINLTTDNGGSNDDVYAGTLFDDSESVSAVAWAYADLTTAGPMSPEGNLTRMTGEDPNGTWTLEVGDDAAGDSGALNSWSLDITTLSAAPAAPTTTVMSNAIPIAIVDNTLVTDTMTFAGLGGHTAAVRLYTEITHTWSSDLDITLTAPNGTVIDVSTGNGGSNDDIFNGTLWSDFSVEATNMPSSERLVTEVVYVNLTPEPALGGQDSFSRFAGSNGNGTWTLGVFDGAGGDTGFINRWDLEIDAYPAPPALNEIYISHAGTDDMEYVELKGDPGFSLDGFMVLVVEGDGASAGTLDRVWDLASLSIPASGYFVLGDTAVTPNDFDLGSDNNIENGTETIYLIETVNQAAIAALLGTDVDGDGDLITDIVGLATIVDIIAPVDGGFGGGDLVYDGASTVGPDGSFLPAGIFRGDDAPNGWCESWFLDFDDVVNLLKPRTPGAANVSCPPPVVNYCTAGTTTNGCLASVSTSGIPSVSAGSGFDVTVSSVEGNKFGLIYFGTTGRVAKPWAVGSSSFRCVKSPGNRTGNQMSGGTAGACDGTLTLDFNAWMAANPGRAPLAGQTVNMQGFFRDPPAPRTTNLSDAIEFIVCP